MTALTAREEEVAALMARGLTNGQIADELGITFNTAKWHVSQVISKLGVSSREEAVAAWRYEHSLRRRLARAFAPVLSSRLFPVGAAASGALVAIAVVLAFLLVRGDVGDEASVPSGDADDAVEIRVVEALSGPLAGGTISTGPLRIRDAVTGDVLHETAAADYRAAFWSPTGGHLLAWTHESDTEFGVAVIEFETYDEVRLSAAEDRELWDSHSWAPDGSAIAVSSTDLVIFDTALREVARAELAPAGTEMEWLSGLRWSPDSSVVAMAYDGALHVLSRDGTYETYDLQTPLNADITEDWIRFFGWEEDGTPLVRVTRGWIAAADAVTSGQDEDEIDPMIVEQLYRATFDNGQIVVEDQPFATDGEVFVLERERDGRSPIPGLRLELWTAMGLGEQDVGGSDSKPTADDGGWFVEVDASGLNVAAPADWPDGARVAVHNSETVLAVFDTESPEVIVTDVVFLQE